MLFDEYDTVKIVDFGLCEHYFKTEKNWYRNNHENTTELSDIYAVGVIFYQMIIGYIPTSRSIPESAKARFDQLPLPVQLIIRGMIQKAPEKRIRSFAIIEKALVKASLEDPTVIRELEQETQKIPVEEPAPQPTRRNFRQGLLVFLLLVILLLLQTSELYSENVRLLFNYWFQKS